MAGAAKSAPGRDESSSTAERLRKNRDVILDLWVERVRREVEPAARQDQLVLADAVPEFLNALADALAAGESRQLKWVLSKEHGEQRAGLPAYLLEQVVSEYELLQQTVFEVLEREGRPSITERELIRAFVTAGIKAAVAAFSGKQMAVIHQQHAVLEAVLHGMAEGVIAVDAKGSVLFSNAAVEHVRGIRRVAGPPEKWPEKYGLFLPDQVTLFPVDQLPVMRALRGEVCDEIEIFVRNQWVPGGLWQYVSARPILDLQHQITGAVTVITDVTKRKRAEHQLKATIEELSRSNAELERFAAVASHDLKEPLRMVVSYLSLLARQYQGRLDADADEFIRYAVDGSKRMTALIDALLAYSRIARERRAFCEVKTAELVSEVLDNLRVAIEENDAEIVVGAMPDVFGDPGMLAHLFQNLIENALKFRSGRRPRIELRAEDKEQEWLFTVHDNGIGIESHSIDRIFDPFVRARQEWKSHGYGIGLAVSKRVVELHQGRIGVESRPGEGSTFFFTLPKIFE